MKIEIFYLDLSIATTQNDFSKFTELQNTTRFISVLKGHLEIVHKNKYRKTLNPYDIDSFQGDWQTSSYGIAKDFNLMLKNADGNLLFAEFNNFLNIEFDCDFIFIYCIDGEIKTDSKVLRANEILISDKNELKILADKTTKIFYGFIKKGKI